VEAIISIKLLAEKDSFSVENTKIDKNVMQQTDQKPKSATNK